MTENFGGNYGIYFKLEKNNQKIIPYDRLDLETLGFRLWTLWITYERRELSYMSVLLIHLTWNLHNSMWYGGFFCIFFSVDLILKLISKTPHQTNQVNLIWIGKQIYKRGGGSSFYVGWTKGALVYNNYLSSHQLCCASRLKSYLVGRVK
jgi:hypothetical protein